MGLFKKPKTLEITGKNLIEILKAATETAKTEVNEGCYIFGPEILFEYDGKTYTAGIKYNKKAAKKAGAKHKFQPEFLSLYLDRQRFSTVADFEHNAMLNGTKITDIVGNIVVTNEFKALDLNNEAVKKSYKMVLNSASGINDTEILKPKYRCPKCGAESFIVTAHVAQDWKVDSMGTFLECMDECVEVTHQPDDDDMWNCANCGFSGAGREFRV